MFITNHAYNRALELGQTVEMDKAREVSPELASGLLHRRMEACQDKYFINDNNNLLYVVDGDTVVTAIRLSQEAQRVFKTGTPKPRNDQGSTPKPRNDQGVLLGAYRAKILQHIRAKVKTTGNACIKVFWDQDAKRVLTLDICQAILSNILSWQIEKGAVKVKVGEDSYTLYHQTNYVLSVFKERP